MFSLVRCRSSLRRTRRRVRTPPSSKSRRATSRRRSRRSSPAGMTPSSRCPPAAYVPPSAWPGVVQSAPLSAVSHSPSLSLTLPPRLLCRPVRDLVCLDMSYCANTCGAGLADKDHLTALSAVGFFRSLFAWLVLGDLLDRNKFCHFGK